MALSFVSLTLMQKIKSIRKMYFYNNDEKSDMILIYGECGKILRSISNKSIQLTLISNLKEIIY
jgi:hypothetical protein